MPTFSVKMLSIKKVYFEGEAEMIVCPGKEGEIGILPNHAPFLSELKKGNVKIKTTDKQQIFNIKSGFIEVASNKVTILVKS